MQRRPAWPRNPAFKGDMDAFVAIANNYIAIATKRIDEPGCG
jgi:hypothetical protein